MVPSLTPYDPPFLEIRVLNAPQQDQLRDACCHLANMIEDSDKLYAVPDIIMSRAMSSLAKLL